jgi:SAM-dependent methyltransferase
VEGPQPLPPGRALDVGCGTGTSTVYLARHGWRVTGVDWIAAALEQARQRAAALADGPGAARFVPADVTAPDFLPDHQAVDLWLDVGCLHGLPAGGQGVYAEHVARLLRPGGRLLVYCWGRFVREDGNVGGLDPDDLVTLFGPALVLLDQVQSQDSVDQARATGWYTFERK